MSHFDKNKLLRALNNPGASRDELVALFVDAEAEAPDTYFDLKKILYGINNPGLVRNNLKYLLENSEEAAVENDDLNFTELNVVEAFNKDGALRATITLITDTAANDGPPEGSAFYIDFVGVSAWAGETPVEITDLMGTDPDSANGWGATEYDPLLLSEVGYGVQGSSELAEPIAFIGDMRTKIISGSTIVIEYEELSGNSGQASYPIVFSSANGLDGLETNLLGTSWYAYSYNGTYSPNETIVSVVGANKIAFTITPTRAEMAHNGVLYDESVLGTLDWPTSGDVFTVALMDMKGVRPIRSITVYDALPDATGLAALTVVE